MHQTSHNDEPAAASQGPHHTAGELPSGPVTNEHGSEAGDTGRSVAGGDASDSGEVEIRQAPPTPANPGGAGAMDEPWPGKGEKVGSPSSVHSVVPTVPVKRGPFDKVLQSVLTYARFIGPGFLVSVAYIDPGNYSTDIAAGASYRFRLLFVVLMSNFFAILLQCLATKLGTVTGMNLAEVCRAFLPRWLNLFLYFMAEAAIIATDMAEVIGTAIAINLLNPRIPLVAGCAISIVDVMLILIFYRPNGSMKGLRAFEFFVMALVLAVVTCFCMELHYITGYTSAGEVFKGYLPNNAVLESQGLYQACGILGATVMPHSLYLGSGIVQSRLKDYDTKNDLMPRPPAASSTTSLQESEKAGDKVFYVPSLASIRFSLKYSYIELASSLFIFALFVNSAILIVAGASLYGNPEALDADIFGIHALLGASIGPAAGVLFALALLFSGVSAGIVCTIAGQLLSEGALRWRTSPFVRRLITRSISITPSIIIAGAAGRDRLNAALNGSQVALSIVLPFVTAPLIWFTCFDKYMTVRPGRARFHVEGVDDARVGRCGQHGAERGDGHSSAPEGGEEEPAVSMANSWYVAILAGLVWLLIAVMNVANIVLLAKGV